METDLQYVYQEVQIISQCAQSGVNPRQIQGVPYAFARFSSLKDFKKGLKYMAHPVQYTIFETLRYQIENVFFPKNIIQ